MADINVQTTPSVFNLTVQNAAGSPTVLQIEVSSAAHTHPISQLQQSGATDGQVPMWNAIANSWIASTVSGGGGGGGTGYNGWSPILTVVSDAERRVLYVSDWTGGSGSKPASGLYVGSSGLVSNVAQAMDIRGATGATGATGSTGPTGPAGAIGPVGATGATGPAGAAATVGIGSVTTGNAGTNAQVSNSGTSSAAVLNFTIPRGDTGLTGPAGPTGATGPAGTAATVTVGTTTTGTPGSNAAVSNSGTTTAAILNFTVPAGATGATGQTGATGATGPQGPAGPAPSGTGLVSVTGGVLDTPSTLSARVAADASNLRTQLGLGTAATQASSAFAAASHTHALSDLTQSGATNGQFVGWNGTAWAPASVSGGSGGTVTSVGLSAPAIFSVSGSPVTSSGTLSFSLASQAANLVFASPNGASGSPTFRSLVASDIPALNYAAVSHTHAASDVTSGTFDILRIPTGTTASTVCIGNDSRLSDSRTPTSHTHGNITNAGSIGAAANLPLITTTSGVITTGSFGTTANTFCQGNDSRLSDSRTPTAHASSHASGGSDALTLAQSQITNLTTDLAAKAPLASPALTGIPTSTTAAADTNTTQIATTAYVVGQAASATPAALGTAAVGTSLKYARADHVHALPTINLATGVTSTLPIANGGTGQTTATAAFNGLAPGTTKGDLIVHNGTDEVRLAVGATAGHVLTVDSTTATGLKWAAASGGGSGGGSTNIWIPAAQWIPRTTNGCGIDSRELATNKINTDELLFDPGTAEYAQAMVVLPNNWNAGTVTARFFWTASTGSGAVVWALRARSYADDDALDQAMGTAQSVTDTLLATNDMHISAATSAITIGGTVANGNAIIFEAYRDATNGSDTLGSDARFLGLQITYTAA
jgi:hypothetical protein